MSEKLNLTKEQLIDLLKAAHKAYQGESKPPQSTSDEWADWYANYIVDQLEKTGQPATRQLNYPPSKISTAKLTEPPAASDKPDATSGKPEPDTSGLQVCPTCAHRNRPGVLFCENCGTNLLTGAQASVGTRDLREAQDTAAASVNEALSKSEKPVDTGKLILDEDKVAAVSTAGSNVFATDMVLRVEVEGGATPILIKPKAEDMILGRRDPTTGATPEVDLTSYAGYRMGVSRRHSSLALENNRLNLWDLGSSNGTFINGTRLTPHQPSPVRDGDEVRLGQMVLRLFFQKSTREIK